MSKYYAIKNGYIPGIYKTWPEAQKQVNGFKGAVYKSFKTEEEANNYLNNKINYEVINQVMDEQVTKVTNKSKCKKIIYKDGAYKPILEHFDIIIYTDGSSVNYVGGYGFVVLTNNGMIDPHFGHIDGHCTNQAAELSAIYHALNYIIKSELSMAIKGKILIRSDSNYSIKSLTQYINTWKRNGYLTAEKEPIKNKELIINISNLLDQLNVKFEHVRSHEGEYYNEMADKLADQGVNDTTKVVAL